MRSPRQCRPPMVDAVFQDTGCGVFRTTRATSPCLPARERAYPAHSALPPPKVRPGAGHPRGYLLLQDTFSTMACGAVNGCPHENIGKARGTRLRVAARPGSSRAEVAPLRWCHGRLGQNGEVPPMRLQGKVLAAMRLLLLGVEHCQVERRGPRHPGARGPGEDMGVAA